MSKSFADDLSIRFVKEICYTLSRISINFVPEGAIDIVSALV